MTKILALIGSHRKKGNTARIMQMIEKRMQALAMEHTTPLEFEMLFLGDMDIRMCRGCRACFDQGENRCPLKDDVPHIRAKMDAAKGLLLASPVYVDDVSGLVKKLTLAEELQRYQMAADRVADKLFRAISQQQALNPALVSLMAYKIQQLTWQREHPGSYDYTYWQARGWLAPGCTFYLAHQANPVKVALARLAGAVVYRFVV